MTHPTKRCDKCRSFAPIDTAGMSQHFADQNPGRCRRFPPVLAPVTGTIAIKWEWPLVYGTTWCNEFRKLTPIAERET